MFYDAGRVYNVTPYMEFHPGGEDELMRGAGKDGTSLFDEVRSCSRLMVDRQVRGPPVDIGGGGG